jgi:hypothetical protein
LRFPEDSIGIVGDRICGVLQPSGLWAQTWTTELLDVLNFSSVADMLFVVWCFDSSHLLTPTT